jgi:integrase
MGRGKSDYLHRRGDWYYFRLHIPLDLQTYFRGRRELRQSLKTTSYTTAKSLLPGYLYRADRFFARMRRAMTDEQIRQLVSGYLKQTLQDEEYDTPPLDPEDHAEALDTREILQAERREELALRRYERVHHVADGILEEAGINIPFDSPAYRKLCRELLKGIIEGETISMERMKGDYSNKYDKQSSYLSTRTRPEVREKQEPEKQVGEPMSKLVEEYQRECIEGNNWGDGTQVEAEGVYRLFLRLVGGDRGIKTLDRRAMVNFRDTLTRWPTNVNKKPQYRGKSVAEVLKIAATTKDKTQSVTNVNKYLTYVRAFLSWAVANGYAETNFGEGLTISKRNVDDDEERKAYDVDDLRRLLSSPVYTTELPVTRPERYFVPLIGLLSGMRAGEICQLHVEDIKEVEGVPVFDVNAKGDRQLKNASSARLIPVHPLLIELGLLKYVEKMRAKGERRLWPRLHKKRGSYGQDFSRWYQRLNREHVSKDRLKVFHSFRHSFETALMRAHVPETVMKELAGHSHGSIDLDRYGKGFTVKQLLGAVEKVNYGIEGELKKLPRLLD